MEVVTNQRDRAEAPASERVKNGVPPSPGSKVTRAVMLLLIVLVVAVGCRLGDLEPPQGQRAAFPGDT